jgi:hypothetical protein
LAEVWAILSFEELEGRHEIEQVRLDELVMDRRTFDGRDLAVALHVEHAREIDHHGRARLLTPHVEVQISELGERQADRGDAGRRDLDAFRRLLRLA